MKLPSGKEVKLKTPTPEELKKFSLSGVIVSDVIEPLIEIGKCKKCGEPLTININDIHH
jgi:hypothetical protein